MLEDGAAWSMVSATCLATAEARELALAEEVAIALSCNGVPHVVTMATPQDLEDFAVGFAITDGIIRSCAEIRGVTVQVGVEDARVDLALAPTAFRGFLATRRRRALRGHTSCGVCGVEDLEELPRIDRRARMPAGDRIAPHVLRATVAALRTAQPLGRITRATHAAVLADATGAIRLGREDIGRHNALDKLIGAAARAGVDAAEGVCIITSRCSFEMVQKAVAGGIATLVALSAPTALAVRLAEAADLTLIGLAGSTDPVAFAAAAGTSTA
jgi:FdhD protein